MFLLTIVGGVLLFGVILGATTFGAFQIGFKLSPALAPLLILAACLILLVLWPISYILRWIWCKIRKQEMGPVHPEIIVPRWLSLSTKLAVGAVVLLGATICCTAVFLNVSLIGYRPLQKDQSTKLASISFKKGANEASVYDITAKTADNEWPLTDQSGEIWLVKANVFKLNEYPQKVFGNFGLVNCARVTTLCKRESAGLPVLTCKILGEPSFFENLLTTFAPYLRFVGIIFEKVDSEELKPEGQGKLLDIIIDGEKVKMTSGGSSGSASGGSATTSSPSSGTDSFPSGSGDTPSSSDSSGATSTTTSTPSSSSSSTTSSASASTATTGEGGSATATGESGGSATEGDDDDDNGFDF